MIESILTYVLTTIIGLLIGFGVSYIKTIKHRVEALKCILRSSMVGIYYEYRNTKKIPYYKKETFTMNFDVYTKLKGNSFIQEINKEVNTWEVV